MLRFIAKRWTKVTYSFREEQDAAMKDLNASASEYHANEKRRAMQSHIAQADAIDASIKRVDELQEKGFWLCDNGHEEENSGHTAVDTTGQVALCHTCNAPKKFIKRSEMTGQQKYESEKERKEAVQMADANRAKAKELEEQIKGHEDTAAMFRKQAQQSREFAELLRKL
jgi:hypothetical protein